MFLTCSYAFLHVSYTLRICSYLHPRLSYDFLSVYCMSMCFRTCYSKSYYVHYMFFCCPTLSCISRMCSCMVPIPKMFMHVYSCRLLTCSYIVRKCFTYVHNMFLRFPTCSVDSPTPFLCSPIYRVVQKPAIRFPDKKC